MTNTANATAAHSADCMCVKCLMSDMDAHLSANGMDAERYAVEVTETAERTRYAAPGAACGRGVVRKASPAQVALIKRLMSERDTRNLVRLPGSEDVENVSLKGASDLIERLFACPELPKVAATIVPPSDAQVRFALSLAARKGLELVETDVRAMDRRDVSRSIDTMQGMADAPKSVAPESEAVTEGMYRDPATGDIFKVQKAHHGSGNLYAKLLVELEDVEIKRGKEYSHGFAYAAGAIRKIQPEWRMTLEQAKEFGALYGVCCRCGAVLTDEKSIADGIGPVCGTKF